MKVLSFALIAAVVLAFGGIQPTQVHASGSEKCGCGYPIDDPMHTVTITYEYYCMEGWHYWYENEYWHNQSGGCGNLPGYLYAGYATCEPCWLCGNGVEYAGHTVIYVWEWLCPNGHAYADQSIDTNAYYGCDLYYWMGTLERGTEDYPSCGCNSNHH